MLHIGREDMTEHNKFIKTYDNIVRIVGLINAIKILIKNDEHKKYDLDPVDDLFIIINEKFDEIKKFTRHGY